MKKMLLPLLLWLATAASAQDEPTTLTHLPYDNGVNNWLNVYPATGNGPRPVLIWAHANGGTANGLQKPLRDSLRKYNIAIVSWESIPTLTTAEHIDTAEGDFFKVLAWVKSNAGKYHFDTKNIFVGGGSRGTVVSFKGATDPGSGVKGIYFVEAIPVRSWLARDFTAMVKPGAAPLLFCYVNPFGTSNAHTPDKAQPVVDRYKAINNGKAALYQGIGKEHLFDRLVPFILQGQL